MRLVLLPFMILSACAAAIQIGPAAPDPTPTIVGEGTDPDATITIYRRSQTNFIANVAATPSLAINGKSVGTCRFDRPLVLRLADGKHVVSAHTENGQASAEVSVDAGETIYLRCGTETSPAFSPRPSLQPVDTATARRELNH